MYNRFGVDVDYFKKELSALSKSLDNRPPDELARYLSVLADCAKRSTVDNASVISPSTDNSDKGECDRIILRKIGDDVDVSLEKQCSFTDVEVYEILERALNKWKEM